MEKQNQICSDQNRIFWQENNNSLHKLHDDTFFT